MKMIFNSEKFSEDVRMKMYKEWYHQKRRIGLREFGEQIGISAATLSRIERGNVPDVETFFKICKWLKSPMSRFINL